MAFDPSAPTQADLSRYYWLVWLGFAGHLATLAFYLINGPQSSPPLVLYLSVGVLLNAVFQIKTDDYFKQLCSTGLRWSLGFTTLYLLGLLVVEVYDDGRAFGGFLAAGKEVETIPTRLPAILGDAFLIAMLGGLSFYLGYLASWLRDHFDMEGEE